MSVYVNDARNRSKVTNVQKLTHICENSAWGNGSPLSRGAQMGSRGRQPARALASPPVGRAPTPFSLGGGLPPAAMAKPRPGFGRALVLLTDYRSRVRPDVRGSGERQRRSSSNRVGASVVPARSGCRGPRRWSGIPRHRQSAPGLVRPHHVELQRLQPSALERADERLRPVGALGRCRRFPTT